MIAGLSRNGSAAIGWETPATGMTLVGLGLNAAENVPIEGFAETSCYFDSFCAGGNFSRIAFTPSSMRS
jgi:hypothetical protein